MYVPGWGIFHHVTEWLSRPRLTCSLLATAGLPSLSDLMGRCRGIYRLQYPSITYPSSASVYGMVCRTYIIYPLVRFSSWPT